ncbi:MAG: N-acetylmuramoyl-L-alanine amidase [Phreatobacter sp.]|uniref:N-acetylmuramoyl-L-alanine amidase n=1 Tax=Phreatobacter sp. TaxID=1966341 RepID=UPI002735C029|nr:N-acetylmuramoyl-L-alanine amidase [Phreatobacter sp.]MDP2803717.1 N-acetylmuramoyl-L-alanine amidase [Phreatobacter sp.]
MSYSVMNHRLCLGGRPAAFRQSPHGGRPLKPRFLVLHYTAGLSVRSAVDWFLDPRARASAHLVLGRQGEVTQMMPLDRTCWHCGTSEWQGLSGLNGHSLGIEIVNAGKLARGAGGGWRTWTGEVVPDGEVVVARHRHESSEAGWHAYPAGQIDTVVAIGKALHAAYGFGAVLGHEEIAPRRKIDPGPAFPLAEVAARILGRG